jgi:hypothetical protein
MNPKLLRSDYYNEDYPLNSQEEKEFYLPVCLPYYKIRARAFLLDLDIFGSKSSLSQQVELFLFNSPEKKLPSKSDCEKVSNCDFFEKRFGFLDASLPTNKNNSLLPIYTVIPEIKALQKNISYSQTYLALGKLCDPQMLFINMFKEKPENNLINALIYFPFTPDDIEHVSNDIIIQLAQYYGLCSNK